ncbi:MAG: CRTAC1 family protein [bacterium]|nr:CRTAC1 family protein [bacterium]
MARGVSVLQVVLPIAGPILVMGCGGATEPVSGDPGHGDRGAPPPAVSFVDRSRQANLDFTYFNGMTGRHYLLEVMGGGAALFDADNDGDLDLYVVQGARLADGREPLEPRGEPGDRLFRNDSAGGEIRFTDVTEGSGIGGLDYGMGVTAGDYDNDGRVDLYVTNWGPNRLLHNDGVADGGTFTFTDVSHETGTADDRWSVAAVFFDYDRDGWLDLYVGNYVDFSLAGHKACIGFGATEDYCGPAAYPARPDRLLRNLGADRGGRVSFADVTTEAGLHRERAPALGAVSADFDGDGWPDLYVANDQADNLLWINGGDGTFSNEALLAGCAVSAEGKAEASMGVAAADFDADGDLDLFLTHLTAESNTLYVNDGTGGFDDATIRAGLEAGSWDATGFGAAWLDFELDGWLDLVTVNGAVHRIEELHLRGVRYPLQQRDRLYRNLGDGSFEELAPAPPAFEAERVSRGLAVGDVDNDGDADLVIVDSNARLRLLINDSPRAGHWLGLRLVGGRPARDMLGARAVLVRPGRSTLVRRVHTDGSYGSARDPRVLFGLGDSSTVSRLEVYWPDGTAEAWEGLALDRYLTLSQGTGEPLG